MVNSLGEHPLVLPAPRFEVRGNAPIGATVPLVIVPITAFFCSAKFSACTALSLWNSTSRQCWSVERGRVLSVLFPTHCQSGETNQSGETEQNKPGTGTMTPHDQALLEKQLRGIDNRPPEGILMLAIATVFFAGMAVGGFLFAYNDQPPLRMAANDTAQQTPQPVLPTTR
jgi:hypothetical protein